MKRDQDLVREKVNDDNWNHDDTSHDLTTSEEDSTLLVLLRPVALAYECFEGSVETLDYGEAEYIDQHVSHTNTSKEFGLVHVTDKVGVCQLDNQEEKQTHNKSACHLCDEPETLQHCHVVGELWNRILIITPRLHCIGQLLIFFCDRLRDLGQAGQFLVRRIIPIYLHAVRIILHHFVY